MSAELCMYLLLMGHNKQRSKDVRQTKSTKVWNYHLENQIFVELYT